MSSGKNLSTQEQLDLLYQLIKNQQEQIELINQRLDLHQEAIEKSVNVLIQAAKK